MFKFLGSANRKLNQDYVIATADKVPASQKFGYGLGTIHDMWGHWLYPGLAYLVFNIYLGTPPEWIGRAMLFKLLFEAIWDSFFGWLSDNTRTRFGRRRPYMLIGGILAGLGLPFLFAASPGWGVSHFAGLEVPNYFWFMIGTLAFYVPIISCFNMPFQSLGAELTPDYHERTNVFSFKSAMQKVPEVAMFAAGAFTSAGVWVGATLGNAPGRLDDLFMQTVHWFGDVFGALFAGDFVRFASVLSPIFGWKAAETGESANAVVGAQVYCTLLGLIMIVAAVAMFFLVKERYYSSLVVARKQDRVSIQETLWQTLKCRPFRANLAMALSYGIGTSMVGTLGYYATLYYVCNGDVAEGNGWNFWMGLSGMVLGLCGIPVYAKIARMFGKRFAMASVQLTGIAVFVATWWLYTPSIHWLQVFASGFIAFTGAGFWMLYGSMGADVIDYDELESGKRREGAFSACGSWIMKAGIALGAWASGEILGATGFDATLGGNQLPQAIFWIRFLLAAIPITGLVFALIALSRFGLSQERTAEVRLLLEARRGKA